MQQQQMQQQFQGGNFGGGCGGSFGGKGGGGGGQGKTTIQYQGGGTPASGEEVEYFIAEHGGLEPASADRFRSLDPVMQKMVMNKGTMQDARDQNAVLHGRINQVGRMTSGGLQMEADKLKPGDWICPNCLDHQFGKNSNCRKCGTAKEMAQGQFNTQFSGGAQLPELTQSATPQEVQQFLSMHQIEHHAADMLMHLDPKLQKLVLNKGSLQEARDQTAMLMGRIKQVTKVASGGMDMNLKPGDWICPGCLDVQFSRNASCRQCGTPKPAQHTHGQPQSQGQAWAQNFMQGMY